MADSIVEKDVKRRSFVRKLVSLAAGLGVTGLLLGEGKRIIIPAVQATAGGTSGTALIIDGSPANTGTGVTELDSNVASQAAFLGTNSNTSGIGVSGAANSGATSGIGVRGLAGAPTGLTFGVIGESDSTTGIGVEGFATKTTGTPTGVLGTTEGLVQGMDFVGVMAGVHGVAKNGTGVFAESSFGTALNANAGPGTFNEGVHGSASSTTGIGVHGHSLASGGIGVEGSVGDPGAKPLVAKGAASQTANLQEWQNSSGTALSVVDPTGKIGSGTTAPTAQVHGVSNGIGVKGESSSGGTGIPMVARGAASQSANLQEWQNSSGTALSAVDKLGNLGVGTGVPAELLHVFGASGNLGMRFENGGNAAGDFSVQRYFMGGVEKSVVFTHGNDMTFRVTSGANPTGNLIFQDAGGKVGIGTAAPTHQLQLSTDDAAKPGTNTWTIASDGRLKDPDSIRPFTESSDFIKRLPQPVWFRYTKESGLPSETENVGWVAQDIEPIAPFMVRRGKQKLKQTDTAETETLLLNTNELPYAVVNCLKELMAHVGKLQEDLTQLKERNLQLESRLETLKSPPSPAYPQAS